MPKDINVVETSNANKILDIPVRLEPGQVNTLSFSQDSISEMRALPKGELEIVFRDGSKVTIENFDELVNSAQSCGRDTIIQLSDNTIIYPEELATQLANGPVNFASTDSLSAITLNAPKAGQVIEKNIESGHEYKLNFAFDQTLSAAQAGQNLIITFKDGGVLILKNYYTAMGSELPPAMTLADGSVIDSNALLTSCKLVEVPSIADSLAAAAPAAGEEKAEEVVASAARKGEGAPDVEPAAGGDPSKAAKAAQSVADIEPAAGDAGANPASSSRGYGFGSSIDGASLNGIDPIGPIGATQLAYGANFPQGQLSPAPDVDTIPVVVGAANAVDETNLGPNVVTGNAGANFFGDGPGSVTPNTTFVAGGSLAGGVLTSNGAVVAVTVAGNTITGTAGGVTVFTLVIDAATGNYTFTQTGPLDHADATDPNDLITLQFGVTATDADGDVGIGIIQIGVYDDGPVAIDDGASVGSGPFVVSGNVTDNDDAGADVAANVTQVVFNGVVYTVPAVGTVSITATYGTLVIGANGAYSYTSSNTAEGIDQFTYTLVDFDGDADTAVLSVEVTDIDTIPTIAPAVGQVDETNLTPTAVNGTLTADFKDDGPGTFTLTSVTPGGSLAGGALTSGGVPVAITLSGNTYTASAGGTVVFTLVLDPATGAYTYTQFAALDHNDATDPNDVITMTFGVDATDTDGDVAPTTITISILDDAPVAANDSAAVTPGTTSVSGNVLTNDDANNDGGAHVTQVTFNGVTYAVPAVGTINIVGAYGTLVIGANGAYTYTSSNIAEGTDIFTYTMADYDNDPATATLTLTVEDIDTNPVVTPAVNQLDETGPQPESVSGSITANFGDDGPGVFSLTGVTPGGSLAGGTLSSNGVPVTFIYSSEGSVIGVAGGQTVFLLALNTTTGAYTFTQFLPLDHADGSNPNDVITLQFGVNATDSDGDATPTTITISILDDAPVAVDDVAVIDPVTLTVGGNVTGNDTVGNDKPGYIVTTVSFAGTDYAVPASGTITVNGVYGQLSINSTGAFTYTSFNTGEGTDQFTYTIRDQDGDTDTASLNLTVPDIDTCPVVGTSTVSVDETNLGPNVATGTVPANFYDDGPGTINFNGGFSFSGSSSSSALYSCGDLVTVSLSNGVYTGVDADGVTVFTLSLNPATGAYVFTQYKGLDHADPTNPDDVLTLTFGVTGTDSDGDSDTGTITININDDGPTAHDDHNLFDTNVGVATGNVISGLNGGAGAADVLSKDGHNHVTVVTYKGVDYPVPATGTTTINGDYGTLTIQSNGSYTYTLYDAGGTPGTGGPGTFSETLGFPVVGEGSPTFNESSPNEGIHPDALDITTAATGTVQILSETAGYSNTLGCYTIGADGTILAVQVIAANVNDLALGGTSNFDIPASGSGVGFFLIADGFNLNGGYAGMDLSTGSLAFYYHYGQPDQRLATIHDAAGDITLVDIGGVTPVVISGPVYHTTDRDGDNSINPDGDVHTISGLTDPSDPTSITIGFEDLPNQGDQDFSDVVFTFTYVPTPPTGTHDEFVYTLVDCDGDSDTAILTFDGQDLIDDVPVITVTNALVDETTVNATGPQTVTGTITVDFGADAPGTLSLGGFTPGGSMAGGALTSNGIAVAVAASSNQYIGTAGGQTIFTLTLNSNGTYTFVQYGPLDHADTSNPNDAITLSFGLTATDIDGDSASSAIVITVNDDGPSAANDVATVGSAPGSVSGNVTGNDSVGLDKPGYVVTSVSTAAGDYAVPATGSITINGTHGTLTISASGAYTYQATSAGSDVFTYSIADEDGDTAEATLTVTVNDIDTCPTIQNAFNQVDETALDDSGTQTVTGTLVVDYLADGPGTVSATGNFGWTNGPVSGTQLTSNGSVVSVALSGNVYTGTSADGRTIFTLQVNANGTYTFNLIDQLDHSNPNNPNDVINLTFGVLATDTDGDTATAKISINVYDDGPVAANDTNTVSNAPATVTGNVLTNDDAGADEVGIVKSVTFGTVTVNVPATGTVTITGAHGSLTIGSNGAYSYTGTSTGVDQFTYTMADYDGDKASACLTITVTDLDTCPTIENAFNKVDETALDDSGTQTVTGTLVVDYKADGPGSVSATGNFGWTNGTVSGTQLTSHGSLVSVALSGGVYTGTSADGRTVFTLQVNADGTYSFSLIDQLDHADPTNPDDVITLTFGVLATDTDGDTATGKISIKVYDDGPVAVNDTNTVGSAPGTANGNVLTNDDAGADEGAIVKSVTFNGTTYAVPLTGSAVIVGAHGTLSINSSGVYSYSGTSAGSDVFAYQTADYDGDTANATLTITVNDIDTCPTIENASNKVDETALDNTGTQTVNGTLVVDYKADGPGTTTPSGAGTFSASGSLTGALKSNGSLVTVTLTGDTYTGTSADGRTVFTLQIRTDGTYTFKLIDQLDHANPANPDDIINLSFGVTATDSDGDTDTAVIQIAVHDDGPVAVDDVATVGTAPGSASGNVLTNDDAGADEVGIVKAVTFGTTTVAVPATGTVTVAGAHGTLTIAANGTYTYQATSAGVDQFTYTLADFDGDVTTAKLTVTVNDIDTCPTIENALNQVDETALDNSGIQTVSGTLVVDYKADGPGTVTPTGAGTFSATGSLSGGLKSNGSAVTVTLSGDTYTGTSADGRTVFTLKVNANGTYTFSLIDQIDHANPNNPNDVITLGFGVTATDTDGDAATAVIQIKVYDDGPVAVNDENTVTNAPATVTGNVLTNDDAGADEPGILKSVTFGTVTVNVPATGNITITGAHGSLTINSSGAYSYTGTSVGTDQFAYTMADYDGDKASACLTITVTGRDDQPVIGDVVKTVDETNLGPNVVTGTIPAEFYTNGPGTLALTGFSAAGSIKGGQLASCGDLITVSLQNGNYVGIDADGVTVFTLAVNAATGAYTFTQFKALDHANPNDPNDIITLNFTVTGTDADGDTDTGTITIHVKDDAPIAHDDVNPFTFGTTGHDSGNVLTGLNGGPGAADVLSKDGGNKVTMITFGGVNYDVPSTGTLAVNGDHGVLRIAADGSYTYDLYNIGNPEQLPFFNETLPFPVVGEGSPTFNENSPNEGVHPLALDIATSAHGQVTIISETAGFSNTLGLYTIGVDGTIHSVQVVSANVNDLALGGTTNFEIPPNGQGVGFFLIGNGFAFNNGYSGLDLSAGNLAFYYNYGQADQRLAKVTDNAAQITLVALEPSPVVLNGPVYHTTDRDGSTAINPDGLVHTISGLATPGDPTVLRIGFEDLPAQGDQDFSDVVFDFCYTPAPPQETLDVFCYTVTDCDGDSSSAYLTLDGSLGMIPISQPVVDVNVNVNVTTNVNVTSEVTVTSTVVTSAIATASIEGDTARISGAVQMDLVEESLPYDGGFTVYFDPETGTVVCGIPPWIKQPPIAEPPIEPIAPLPEGPWSGPEPIPGGKEVWPVPAPDTKLPQPILSDWPVSADDVLLALHDIQPIKVADFDPGEGDVLDLSALVQEFDPVTDAISDFVYARSEGNDTIISVDPTGQGVSSQAIDVVVLQDVSSTHVEDVVQLVQQQQNQSGTGTI